MRYSLGMEETISNRPAEPYQITYENTVAAFERILEDLGKPRSFRPHVHLISGIAEESGTWAHCIECGMLVRSLGNGECEERWPLFLGAPDS